MAEPIRTGGGNVGVVQEIDSLTEIAPRRAGSEGERRAARQLQQRLQELGRDAELEPIRIRPGFAATHLIHVLGGIVGSVVAVYAPLVGLAIAAIATISAFGELTGAFQLVRLLMPVRASQNVVSDEDTGKPGVIVLVAHYDAPRDAALYGRRLAVWPRAVLGSLALITICAVGRVLGIDATWFTVVQFIPTVVLIASAPLFADAALADTTRGASDNAAGVATALRVAKTKLEHFDLMLVFTGGSAHFGLGMREWLRRHRKELDSEATAVICIDNLASGTAAYAAKEGPVFASRMHPTLVDLASESATVFNSRELSDAYLARSAGLPTIRISTEVNGADEEVDTDALARVSDFVTDLLERIDAEIGPRLG